MYTPKKAVKRARSMTPGRPVKRRQTIRAVSQVSTDQSTAVVVPRAMSSALPNSMTVKLKYYEALSLDAVGGGTAVNVFSANGCYDPNITGTGHQPRAFDQYMAFYQKGVCVASKITLKGIIANNTDALLSSGLLFVALSPTAVVAAHPPQFYLEDPRCSWVQLNATITADEETRLGFNARSFFSYKDPVDESDLHFNTSTNPTQQAYFHVGYGAINGTANPGAINIQVMIEYTVKFFEPVSLASS